MLRFFALAGLLSALAGCAAPPPPAHPTVLKVDSPGRYGVVLARHPVPDRDPRPLRQWLRGLDGGLPGQGMTEYVVHVADGDVIAVVQASNAGLRPGDTVRILQSEQTSIQPVSASVAAR